jgi:hypothetical protein
LVSDKRLLKHIQARGLIFRARANLLDLLMLNAWPVGIISRPHYDETLARMELWLEQLDAEIKAGASDEE